MATQPITKNIDILYIVGPTASGKSALAMQLAQELNGEIICADSRTIYKGLSIATAKPSAAEQATIKHYGLDIVSPNQSYSASQFQADARGWIATIQAKGKLPIIVGGTGLYIDGLLFNYEFGAAANPELRAELAPLSVEQLQERIQSLGLPMPQNNKNKRYLERAIEQGGINTKRSDKIASGTLVIGLNPNLEVLKERIIKRAGLMLEQGALQEAKEMFNTYGYDAPAAAPFYRAFRPYFEEGLSAKECLKQYIQNDMRLAKRQVTWFKRNTDINWFTEAEAAHNFVQATMNPK